MAGIQSEQIIWPEAQYPEIKENIEGPRPENPDDTFLIEGATPYQQSEETPAIDLNSPDLISDPQDEQDYPSQSMNPTLFQTGDNPDLSEIMRSRDLVGAAYPAFRPFVRQLAAEGVPVSRTHEALAMLEDQLRATMKPDELDMYFGRNDDSRWVERFLLETNWTDRLSRELGITGQEAAERLEVAKKTGLSLRLLSDPAVFKKALEGKKLSDSKKEAVKNNYRIEDLQDKIGRSSTSDMFTVLETEWWGNKNLTDEQKKYLDSSRKARKELYNKVADLRNVIYTSRAADILGSGTSQVTQQFITPLPEIMRNAAMLFGLTTATGLAVPEIADASAVALPGTYGLVTSALGAIAKLGVNHPFSAAVLLGGAAISGAAFEHTMMLEGGMLYDEILDALDEGADAFQKDESARAAQDSNYTARKPWNPAKNRLLAAKLALIGGAINGYIEIGNMGIMLNTVSGGAYDRAKDMLIKSVGGENGMLSKMGKRQLKSWAARALKDWAINYIKSSGTEGLEEYLQSLFSNTLLEIGKAIAGKSNRSAKEVLEAIHQDGWGGFTEIAKGMLVTGLPGGVINAGARYQESVREKAIAAQPKLFSDDQAARIEAEKTLRAEDAEHVPTSEIKTEPLSETGTQGELKTAAPDFAYDPANVVAGIEDADVKAAAPAAEPEQTPSPEAAPTPETQIEQTDKQTEDTAEPAAPAAEQGTEKAKTELRPASPERVGAAYQETVLPSSVYVSSEAMDAYLQTLPENERETLRQALRMRKVDKTGEYLMRAKDFVAAGKRFDGLERAVAEDVRRGSLGMTRRELTSIKDKVRYKESDPMEGSSQIAVEAREVRDDMTKKLRAIGYSQEQAEVMADAQAHAIFGFSRLYGIDPVTGNWTGEVLSPKAWYEQLEIRRAQQQTPQESAAEAAGTIAQDNNGVFNQEILLPTDYDENGNVRPEVVQEIKNELAIIRSEAKANGTYLKAPSGRPSNLKAGAWELVRTKRFKNWFGDWEAAQVAQKVRSLSAQPLNLSGVSLEKKEAEARFAAFGEIENERYGVKATFPNNTAGKILRHKGFDVTQIIDSLPELFRTSVLALSEPEIPKEGHKPHNNIRAYHHFVNKFTVTGKDYYIRFTAYEENTRKPTNRRSIHSTAISAVDVYEDNKKASPRSLSGNNPGVAEQMPFIDTKIANLFDSVNGVSQVVDANGEPKIVYHGTSNIFDSFDKTRVGSHFGLPATGRLGFYFTNDDALANDYAAHGYVMPVFLRINTPLVIEDTGWGSAVNQTDARESDLRRWAQEGEHDGIIVRSTDEELLSGEPDTVYVAFEPEQIKSVDNRGTFDAGENIFYQNQVERRYKGKLHQDSIAWAKAVDKYLIGEMGSHDIVHVMDMPIALELAGVPVREIVADKTFFNHTISGKHSGEVKPALMKKLVRSLADPIMVFDSASHPGTSLVAMLELEDDQGATIVVPVRLQMDPTDPNSPAKITSFYGKGDPQTGTPNNKWFIKQVVDKNGNLTGRLKYVNRKKISRWSSVGGLQLPKALAPSRLPSSISTEADLVKYRKFNGNRFYQSAAPSNTLIATHGIDVSALEKAFANFDGQLPMPSLAIGRRGQQGATHYGEITLIGDKNMIDPQQNSLTDVYDTDMWSPTVPRPEYKLDRAKRKAMTEIVNTTFSKWADYKTDAYEIRYRLGADDSTLDDIIRSAAQKIPFRAEYISQVLGKTPQIVRDEQGSIDDSASRLALLEQFRDLTGHDSSAYDKWVESQFRQLAGEALVKVGRKMLPYTAENVLEAMRKKGKLASEDSMFFGSGKVRAKGAKKLTSIEAMHKAEGQLATKQDFETWKEQVGDPAFKDAHSKLTAEMTRAEKAKGYEPNPFDMLDEAARALAGFISGKKSLESVTGIPDLSEETKAAAQKYKDVIAQAKTEYFEAKPRRLVSLSEFRAAVVPASTQAELRQKLEEQGLKVYEYPDDDEAARQQITELAAQEGNVFFQDAVPGPSNFVPDADYDENGKLRSQVLQELRTEANRIRREAERIGTYLKAPNGQPSNLPAGLWELVRTKRFKQWFGDWTRPLAAQEIRNMPARQVAPTGISLDKKAAEARFASFGEVEHKRYGIRVTFPKGTAGKVLGHQGFEVSQIIDELPELFRGSVLVLSEPEVLKPGHKQHTNIEAYHHFVNKFLVSGKEYYIRFTAYEQKTRKVTDKRSIHSTAISAVEVYEAKKRVPLTRSLSGNSPGVAAQASFLDDKVARLFDPVKDYSAIVDENGEPKVMYHGTPDGSFAEFRPGAYFSSVQQYADRYQNPSASSISTGKQALNPKTFAVFLDIKKPFDLSDPEARRIYIEEYVKGGNAIGINPYLSDEEYAKITDIDWTEGEDLKEFLQENGYDYDGIRLNEGGDPDGNGGVTSRGDSYLVFNPEQIKSVDNRGSFDESANIYNQDRNEPQARGSITFNGRLNEGGTAVIDLFKAADASTFLHESAHFLLQSYLDFGRMANAPAQLKQDLGVILNFLGVKDAGEVGREQHEKWARTVELYFMEGKAPSSALAKVFARMKRWLLGIYHHARHLNTEITPEVREVLDRLYAGMNEEDAEVATLSDLRQDDEAAAGAVARMEAEEAQEQQAKPLSRVMSARWYSVGLDDANMPNWVTRELIDGMGDALAEGRPALVKAIRKLGGIDYDSLVATWGKSEAKELRARDRSLFRKNGAAFDTLVTELEHEGIHVADAQELYDRLMAQEPKITKGLNVAITEETLPWLFYLMDDGEVRDYASSRQRLLNRELKALQNADDHTELRSRGPEIAKEQDLIREILDTIKKPRQQKAEVSESDDSAFVGGDADLSFGPPQGEVVHESIPTKEAAERAAGLLRNDEMVSLKEADRRAWRRAQRESRRAYLEGRKTGAAQQKARAAELKAKQQERKMLKKEIAGILKKIKTAAEDKGILWAFQEKIRGVLAGYTLKNPSRQKLMQAMELYNYLVDHPGEMSIEDYAPADRAYIEMLGTTMLPDMTLGELRALGRHIEELREEGKKAYEQWKAARQQRRDQMWNECYAALGEIPSTEGMVIRGPQDLRKQYKGVKGKLEKAGDWNYAVTLGSHRLMDWIGNGHGKFNSAWTKYFIEAVNTAHDEYLRLRGDRYEALDKVLKANGLKKNDFGRVRVVDGIEYTVDEMLSVYALLKNEKGTKALLYGNFKGLGDSALAHAAHIIQSLTREEINVADAVLDDYEKHFDRLNRRFIEVYNEAMVKEEHYSPMKRLEYTSAQGLIDAESAETIEGRSIAAGRLAGLDKGFTIRRLEISEEHQQPVDLGLLSMWADQVTVQEHMYAFAQLTGDLSSVLLKRNEVNGMTMAKAIRMKYGTEAWNSVVGYTNIVTQNEARLAHSVMNGVTKHFIRGMSVTYLGLTLGSRLKQVTSTPRFLMTVGLKAGLGRLVAQVGKWSINPARYMREAYRLDPQLKERIPIPAYAGYRIDPTTMSEAKYRYEEGLKATTYMLGVCDRVVAAIGWRATYENEIANGSSPEQAHHAAQRAVALTQQVPNLKDMPAFWRQNGLTKLMMVFSSNAIPIWGMTVYDLAQAIKRGDWPKSFVTTTALAVSAMATMLVSHGLPDGDDDDSLLDWMVDAFTEQTITSLPIVGKDLFAAYDELINKNRRGNSYSAFVAPIAGLIQGFQRVSSEKADEVLQSGLTRRQAGGWQIAEAIALLMGGFPVTAMRRIHTLIKSGDWKQALPILLAWQRQKKKSTKKAVSW